MHRSLACLAFTAFSVTPSVAAVLHVNAATGTNAGTCTSSAAPCRTVTYAMAQAASGSPGDEIQVAPGKYDVVLGEIFPIVVKSGVRLRSTSGAASTILDASDFPFSQRRVLDLVSTSAETLIEGFTITGGRPSRAGVPPYGTTYGGGMRIDGGAPTIRRNVFLNNLAQGDFIETESRGGGIHGVNAAPVIENNAFRGNQARGLSPCCLGVHTLYSGAPGRGGAIYLEGTGGTISSNTFYQNAAIGHDGSRNPAGLIAPGGSASHGAVYSNGASVTNNLFASNLAQGGYAGAGSGPQASAAFAALQALNPPTPISNNLFVNNTVNGIAGTDDTFGTASVCTGGPPCPGAHFHGEPSDLRITPPSPAAGAGTATGAPLVDLAGVVRPNPPSIGAFEPSAAFNPARPVNISTRAHVGSGDDVIIGGFVIYGSTPKTVVVRARGPSLAQAGVSGVLANPQLTLFAGQAQVASNDNWQDAANATQIENSGFAPSDPAESAILATLQPGGYTAIVSGAGATTGVAIVEVFEVDAETTLLVNLSTRARVQAGDNVMIAGFIVQGSSPQSVVIRARGPSLAQFGVAGALANPQLTLYSGPTPIASNDNWRDAANAASLISTSGFAPSDFAESAILVTLQPGAYTAIVNGANGTTGVAIVEMFKLENVPDAPPVQFDFQADFNGWQAVFADYPAGATPQEQASIDALYDLASRHATLPAPLDQTQGAVELAGINRSDDLMMVLKRRITGLRPDTLYTLDFTVRLASNAPQGCTGAGGPPGDAVWIKAGASTTEPMRVVQGTHFRLNVDLGTQSLEGTNGRVLGNFANSRQCDGSYPYELITRTSAGRPPLSVRSDAQGGLWLIVATDSGFEGFTRAFFDHVTVTARP